MRNALPMLACCCLILAASFSTPALAQETAPTTAEEPAATTEATSEDTGTASPVTGACYAANQAIFDSYQVQFCLNRPGSYSAAGGEVACEGRMSWRTAGRSVLGNMHPTQCGVVMFQGAQLDCRPQSPDTPIPAEVMACVLYPTNPAQKRQVFDASLQVAQE